VGRGIPPPSDSAAQLTLTKLPSTRRKADLVNAQQSLSDAQLDSPIAGTVASVGISVGATVGADSSTDAVVIVGTQAFETTATLTSSQVNSVKVGDTANVLVDGATKSIAGTVSQVGPVQSSDGTYSYPLVVSLPTSATGLFTGSTATISVITSEAKSVLAVPSSAVITNGTRHDVLVLSGGNLVDKSVKVGLVGYTYTQVTSGLKEGDSVVLADYSEAVPTSNSTTVGGFGGGFGGGGFGGGGAADDSQLLEREGRPSGAERVADPHDHDRTTILVDAANVVGSRPDGWWRDRSGAARSLVDRVQRAVKRVVSVDLWSWCSKGRLERAPRRASRAVSPSFMPQAAVTTCSLRSHPRPTVR